jgi:hypothetical protein
MSKTTNAVGIVASVAAIGLLGAYAFAQQGPGFGPGRMGMGPGMMKGMGPGGMGHGPMMGNFGDPASRLSTLKTDLGIKPEQTAAWDAYAKVVTATATEQREHAQHIDLNAMRNMQQAERQQHFTAMQTQREAAQAKVKAAAEALVAKLDDTQKSKARASLPGLVTAAPGMRFGMTGGPGAGRGMGPPWAR